MAEIKKALVGVSVSENNKKMLTKYLWPAQVIFCNPYDKEKIAENVSGCDVVILQGNLDESILEDKELKWVHCCMAGAEWSARPEVFQRKIILTCSAGRSAPVLAEHALMFMLALTYDLPRVWKAQEEHKWGVYPGYTKRTGLYGKTAGIIGLGNTGKEVARLCHSFHMRTLGYRRSLQQDEYIDEMYIWGQKDSFGSFLENCDYVILCCELNDDTYHMLGKKELLRMKKEAFLINMGRGMLIDEQALIEALKKGKIAGAGLDTFEQEPLPENHPLWELSNVMITPHVTPGMPDREERMLSYVYENIKAYRRGGGFVNRIEEKSIFQKGRKVAGR